MWISTVWISLHLPKSPHIPPSTAESNSSTVVGIPSPVVVDMYLDLRVENSLNFFPKKPVVKINGGGGGDFLKVKRLVLKCVGTQKRLFPEILSLRVGC